MRSVSRYEMLIKSKKSQQGMSKISLLHNVPFLDFN